MWHRNYTVSTVNLVKLAIIALMLGVWVGYILANDSERILVLESQLRQARRAEISPTRQRHSPLALHPSSIRSLNPTTAEHQRQLIATEYKNERYKQVSDEWIARHASEISVEYSRVLDELGMRPEQIEHVKAQLMMIHKMAVEAGAPLRELGDLREKYAQELRSTLGETNYSRYLDYEKSKPASKELDLINAFASKSAIAPMNGALSEQIIRLIKDSKATSTVDWHGPYDPPPRPLVGKENVTQSLNQQISDLTIRANNLLEAARVAGVPDVSLNLLQTYYEITVNGLQQSIKSMNRSKEERMRDYIQKLPPGVKERAQAQLAP